MTKEKEKRIQVCVSMTPGELELIDMFARINDMTRSKYIVKQAAYADHKYVVDLRTIPAAFLPEHIKVEYGIYHDDDPDLPQSEGTKPRKAKDGKRRSENICIRVSPYEKEKLKEFAQQHRMSLSDYLVYSGLYGSELYNEKQSRFILATEELQNILVELRKQGVNLNQIAKSVNGLRALTWEGDFDANLIEILTRGLIEDNERTRAAINDAIHAVVEAMQTAQK